MSEKPPRITEAIYTGNREYLQAAGRKGAEVALRKREEKATLAEIEAEKVAYEEEERRRSANEHIITPDGEDLDYAGD